jgi:hypothetical protein
VLLLVVVKHLTQLLLFVLLYRSLLNIDLDLLLNLFVLFGYLF